MSTAHDVEWPLTAQRTLRTLPEKVAAAAIEFVYGPLTENPRRVGKPLRFELEGLRSARRGDYRILYRIGEQRVTVVAIEHRADAYRPRRASGATVAARGTRMIGCICCASTPPRLPPPRS